MAQRNSATHSFEATFKEERIFGQDEVDEICSTFRRAKITSNLHLPLRMLIQSMFCALRLLYDELPIGQDPPPNCVAPPAPDWDQAAVVSQPILKNRTLKSERFRRWFLALDI